MCTLSFATECICIINPYLFGTALSLGVTDTLLNNTISQCITFSNVTFFQYKLNTRSNERCLIFLSISPSFVTQDLSKSICGTSFRLAVLFISLGSDHCRVISHSALPWWVGKADLCTLGVPLSGLCTHWGKGRWYSPPDTGTVVSLAAILPLQLQGQNRK